MIRIKNLILLCINNSNIPVFHLFRFLKASCFLWSTIWLAINQLQLSTAFKCDCPVLSDLPSLSGRLGPSLSHIAAPPNCQSSERAFCALTKALSVSLWFVTPKRAFHGVLSQFFFSLSARTFSRVQETGQRWREREDSRLGNWELRCACFTSSFSPWLIFDEKFSVSHYSCIHRLAPSIGFFYTFCGWMELAIFSMLPLFFHPKNCVVIVLLGVF